MFAQAAAVYLAHHVQRHGVRGIPLLVEFFQLIDIHRSLRWLGRIVRQQRRAFQAVSPPGIFRIRRESAHRIDIGVYYRMHGMLVDRQFAGGVGKPRQRFFQQVWAVIRQAEIIHGEIVRTDGRRQRPLRIHALLPQRTQLRWRKAFAAR
ncbi:hypothetical protein D3C71_1670020 [compost metagenome]